MSYSSNDKLKSTLVKPLIKAAVSGLASRIVFGDVAVNVLGMELSAMSFGAGLGAASELVSQVVNMYVLPRLESSNRARHFESLVVSLGLSAGSFALLPMLLSGDKPTGGQVMTWGLMGMGA